MSNCVCSPSREHRRRCQRTLHRHCYTTRRELRPPTAKFAQTHAFPVGNQTPRRVLQLLHSSYNHYSVLSFDREARGGGGLPSTGGRTLPPPVSINRIDLRQADGVSHDHDRPNGPLPACRRRRGFVRSPPSISLSFPGSEAPASSSS